ncbi:MAG: mucoidy inhibitor MuiA family protein [Hyphomicrobiales bacterium]
MRIATTALLAASPFALGQALEQAFAADIEIQSRIDAVTVYPDGAMVTRLAAITEPQGASTLLIKGLPAALDPASVRVEAAADGALAIGSVETRLAPGDAKPALDPALDAKIATLREESDELDVRLDALDVKRRSIVRFSEADPAKLGKEDKPIDPAAWKIAWDAVGEELARVNEDIRAMRSKKSEFAAEIVALDKARPLAPSPGAPKRDVAVTIEAGSALEGSLTLVYRVSQAAWMPRYDAKLDTGAKDRKPSLELVRRAEVTQRTGEDWDNAALAVSTVRTLGGTAAPDVNAAHRVVQRPWDRQQQRLAGAGRGGRKAAAACVTRPRWRAQTGPELGGRAAVAGAF